MSSVGDAEIRIRRKGVQFRAWMKDEIDKTQLEK
jgi:hypothetical protein